MSKHILAAAVVSMLLACGPSPKRLPGGEAAATGSFAAELLSDRTYTKLIVTVDYVRGQEPADAALALLQARLASYCRKPEGVTVERGKAIEPLAGSVYSPDDIRWLATLHRSRHCEGTTASIYILYLDGRSSLTVDPSVEIVGVAVTATCFALFNVALDGEAGIVGARHDQIEATALLHETGHLLGLLSLGTPTTSAHEDPAHPQHCVTAACAMNWTITHANTGGGRGIEGVDYDDACRADLRANGGR